MTRTRYSFWMDERQHAGLRRIKDRDGISESEQIRRAIDEWLTARGGTDARTGRTARTGARRRRTRT
jgi:hypothetical protein